MNNFSNICFGVYGFNLDIPRVCGLNHNLVMLNYSQPKRHSEADDYVEIDTFHPVSICTFHVQDLLSVTNLQKYNPAPFIYFICSTV